MMIPLVMPNLTGHEKEYLDNCIDTTYVSSIGEYVTRLEEMCRESLHLRTHRRRCLCYRCEIQGG